MEGVHGGFDLQGIEVFPSGEASTEERELTGWVKATGLACTVPDFSIDGDFCFTIAPAFEISRQNMSAFHNDFAD